MLFLAVEGNKKTTGHITEIPFQGIIFFADLKFDIHFEICYFDLKKRKTKRCLHMTIKIECR